MNNHRDSDKNKLKTFEPRGGENFKNIELQRKKSGSNKKKVQFLENYTFLSPLIWGAKLTKRIPRKKVPKTVLVVDILSLIHI